MQSIRQSDFGHCRVNRHLQFWPVDVAQRALDQAIVLLTAIDQDRVVGSVGGNTHVLKDGARRIDSFNPLFRGAVDKGVGTDPLAATTAAGVMFPYATNVMNNTSAAQITQINAAYPGTFPGGAPVPMFTYYCDTPNGPALCTGAGANNLANNIREVEVTLIVLIQQPDMQTGKLRLVTLNGRGHRVNPKQ